jgi:hypothetical protein
MSNDDLTHDPEAHARLLGIINMLKLPPLQWPDGTSRRRLVEIEVEPDRWVPVDGVVVEAGTITFWSGTNGTRREYVRPAGFCPRWRADQDVRDMPPRYAG